MAYVVITLHGKELQRRKLEGPMTFGRSLQADVTLEDGAISRVHCKIEPDGEQWAIVDLQSRNGTKVNGKPIERQILKQGDVITIGHTKLAFHSGKFVGPRPSDPASALLSETTIMLPPRREPSSRPLPTPKIGRVDATPISPGEETPLPFTRPPAKPIVKREDRD
jgi:pSer/pThr/pTyr-binding forkhead associated (FHA) protein